MTIPPTQPPSDLEAQAGDKLPDPVLPPRALAELRQAFGPSLRVDEEADARVLATLNLRRRKSAHSAGFWRGFQIAAVLALVASFLVFMQARRDKFTANSPFARAVEAQKRDLEKKETDRLAMTDSAAGAKPTAPLTETNIAAAAPGSAAPTAPATYASENVTILDVLKLARKAESSPASLAKKSKSGFKPNGSVVSPFEEVNALAAKVVGCEPAQISALADHSAPAKDEAPAEAEARANARLDGPRAAAAAPAGETRILTYDIMLDVGSRSLAAFQIEISMSAPDTARVTLMGVRGGDHPALQRQPLFDSSRVTKPGSSTTFTIANFDTGKDLPSGDVRVARIVLVVVGPGHPGLTARLVIAAGAEGVPIPAGLRVVERAPITGADLKQKQLDKAVEEAEALPPAK